MGDAILMIEILVLGVLIIGFLALMVTRGQQHVVKPLAEPLPTLPPVLLPEAQDVTAQDIQDIRFAVGLRGYRTDQVDQVLARLSTAIEIRDQQIADLRQVAQNPQPYSNE
ncbi:MAG TPA: DivIVA domain-containing protein [Enteractinococcus helveticum]|uniref:DivIVA domain-containing protein n=1 Tax=Enteractinococcus helveticum TaxID=1837282 RepID=A0A921K7P5_9MICC|nr:DivIVA domain-containing protein [Enteractinococcus helveticum]HJF14361.1 DivIVA domain-containing protein [Enteractinococcus helveticum]